MDAKQGANHLGILHPGRFYVGKRYASSNEMGGTGKIVFRIGGLCCRSAEKKLFVKESQPNGP